MWSRISTEPSRPHRLRHHAHCSQVNQSISYTFVTVKIAFIWTHTPEFVCVDLIGIVQVNRKLLLRNICSFVIGPKISSRLTDRKSGPNVSMRKRSSDYGEEKKIDKKWEQNSTMNYYINRTFVIFV